MNPTTPHPKPIKPIEVPAMRAGQRLYAFSTRRVVVISTLALIAACLLFMEAAHATGFSSGGRALSLVVCDFIKSPYVLVFVAASLVAALIGLTLVEDSRFLTGILKAVIGGLSIWTLGSIITILGIGNLGCS